LVFWAIAASDLLRRTIAAHCEEVSMLDHLLSDWDVEKIARRARSTLQKDRVAGTGIPFIRIGRLVRYRPSDVAAYLDALPSRRSTSETPQGEPRSTSKAAQEGEAPAVSDGRSASARSAHASTASPRSSSRRR
jgi:hypothetical protein